MCSVLYLCEWFMVVCLPGGVSSQSGRGIRADGINLSRKYARLAAGCTKLCRTQTDLQPPAPSIGLRSFFRRNSSNHRAPRSSSIASSMQSRCPPSALHGWLEGLLAPAARSQESAHNTISRAFCQAPNDLLVRWATSRLALANG